MKKRIVYVDQFALSLMMKVLDPDRKGQKRAAVDPFYRKLFEQLDRLGKLMLMVCPYSPIHQIESKGLAKLASPEDIQSDKDAEGVVFRERFEKVRKLFVHLSFGTKFYRYETIRDHQVLTALEAWIQCGDTFTVTRDPRDASEAISGNPNVWLPTIYPALDSRLQADEIQELNAAKDRFYRGLELVVNRWRQEKEKHFDDWFEQEVVGQAASLRNAYRENKPRIKALRSCFGLHRFRYSGNTAAALMMRVLERLEDVGWADDECSVKADEFLASNVFRHTPFVRISSALWAGLAHDLVHAGRKWKPKMKSFGNDVNFISAYLPYCDAMFIEKQCANILKGNPASRMVPEGVRVYSMDTKDAFLDFLKQIESTASPEHLAKVREVYGDDWFASPLELLEA